MQHVYPSILLHNLQLYSHVDSNGLDMWHKPPLLIVKQVFFSSLKAALSVDGALLYQV